MIINIKGKNFRGYNETDNNLELILLILNMEKSV